MRRKLVTLALALTGIIIIGFSILLFLGVFEKQKAGIFVESLPISTVYINGVEVGKTPYEAEREAGEIVLRILPEQIESQILDDYETKVNLTSGIKTIIKREFKESEENSSGVVVSFEKLGVDESYVTVVSVPDNSQVLIDNKVQGYTPLRVKVPAGDHNLVIAADGYIEKNLPIRVFKGFKLTASVKLARNEKQEDISTQTPELVEVIKETEQIIIEKNQVGFLRVRSGANIGFPEIGQVKPDEIYFILEEGENGKWLKILFKKDDGTETEGWVSAEFVTKL